MIFSTEPLRSTTLLGSMDENCVAFAGLLCDYDRLTYAMSVSPFMGLRLQTIEESSVETALTWLSQYFSRKNRPVSPPSSTSCPQLSTRPQPTPNAVTGLRHIPDVLHFFTTFLFDRSVSMAPSWQRITQLMLL